MERFAPGPHLRQNSTKSFELLSYRRETRKECEDLRSLREEDLTLSSFTYVNIHLTKPNTRINQNTLPVRSYETLGLCMNA